MTIEIARYQFHAWARKGISANILEGDDLGAGSASTIERASVPLSVSLNGSAFDKTFSLIGPGDIIGINPDMIIRTDPLNGVTDSEPNYLAFVEFYDEDFPWRFTPAKPQGERIRPWITLLVLKETEFDRTPRTVPLPTILVKDATAMPLATETWLWAHMHSHADIPDAELSDYEKFLLSLNKTVNDDPDQLFSRLMSPRRLEPNTAYHAFIIPTFEVGRLAGIEQPTTGVQAQLTSWDDAGPKGELPVYYEWFFRTGLNEDFESLVKALKPSPMDSRVGIRDMDASRPGFVRADDPSQEIPGTRPPILGLEGALKSPSTVSTTFPDPSGAREFQVELEKVVNLPMKSTTNSTADPILSVPFYGQNHAQQSASDVVVLDTTQSAWVDDLNRDPRTRVGAGFGTTVIQKNQDSYMKRAWLQVQQIIEANRRIRLIRVMMSVSTFLAEKTFSVFPQNTLLAVSNRVFTKIKGSPRTLAAMLRESALPTAALTGTLRRMFRPQGPLSRALNAGQQLDVPLLVDNLNAGKLSAAPPRGIPAGVFTTRDVATAISPHEFPAWVQWLLRRRNWVALSFLVLICAIMLISGASIAGGVLLGALGVGYVAASRMQRNADAAQTALNPLLERQSIQAIPHRPDFSLQLSDEALPPGPTPTGPGLDSLEAMNFRKALADTVDRIAVEAPTNVPAPFDLANAYQKVSHALLPTVSFPSRLVSQVKFPQYISLNDPGQIFPAMAYPDFEDPMYEPLRDISSDLLVPNLNLILPNTVSLLETNQKFIESYLVGLNHEMGRELLWREYPTDLRGSYFRQFWDVKGVIRPADGMSDAELSEDYKDIEPIHTWSPASQLGSHNKRQGSGEAQQLVLVIRGDLLKRYPHTLIFAQKAIPAGNPLEDAVIDTQLDAQGFVDEVKFPLYQAEILPDVKFFGFDLTVEQARGSEHTPGFSDELGWFFVIQEVPGEPRFGMDVTYAPTSQSVTWDDLSWQNFPGNPPEFITTGVRPSLDPLDNHPDKWGVNSADMAYILFRKPSMVAVHATDMLTKT